MPTLNRYQLARAKKVAAKLWNQGEDPKDMAGMRAAIAKAEGISSAAVVSDTMCMSVDDEMQLLCKAKFPTALCGLLHDRPDGKQYPDSSPATAPAALPPTDRNFRVRSITVSAETRWHNYAAHYHTKDKDADCYARFERLELLSSLLQLADHATAVDSKDGMTDIVALQVMEDSIKRLQEKTRSRALMDANNALSKVQ